LGFRGLDYNLAQNFLDYLVRLLFLVLFCGCTIFCLLLWWWPNAPSKWVDVAQSTETQECHRISLTAPQYLVQSTEFLDNIVLLLFPILFSQCTIFWLLLWCWPKAPSNIIGVVHSTETQHNPRNAHRISLTVLPSFLESTEVLDNISSFSFQCSSVCVRLSICCGGGGKLPVMANPLPAQAMLRCS
jgi:hypothetical protein